MIYLNENELVETNKYVINESGKEFKGVLYPQGLSVIIEQPKQVLFGTELYPNIWIKAAFIMQKITKKHIFYDGNKRTSVLATLNFLSLNGHELKFTENEMIELILEVSNNADTQEIMISLAEWLKDHEDNS
jgi:death-on-curing protein